MRLINADELINIIAKQIRCDRHEIICGLLQAFIEQVEAMPTVDAVEVIRCKYCKHWNQDEIFKTSSCRILCDGHGFEMVTAADFFCGHGVRKDGE